MGTTSISMGRQLGLSFAAVIGLPVAAMAAIFLSVDTMDRNFSDVADRSLPSIQTLTLMERHLAATRSAELRHVIVQQPQLKKAQEASFLQESEGGAKLTQDYLSRLCRDEEDCRRVRAVDSAIQAYLQGGATAIKLSNEAVDEPFMEAEAAEQSVTRNAALFNHVAAAFVNAADYNNQLAAQARTATHRAYGQVLWWMGLSVLLSLSLGGGIAGWITRGLKARLGGEPAAVRQAAQSIADGDLTVHISLATSGQASIMEAMRRMQQSLLRTVGQIRQSVDSVSTAAAEIAHGNADLSARTEDQASALQQTVAWIHQMSDSVEHNTQIVVQASQQVARAADVATRGGQVMREVVGNMDRISQSSMKIADIIGVIDGIAFQTNILALNAAVEAARAGEQGRGFAVVASEVRSLARRSADAAKEIKELINSSVEAVSAGASLVSDAGGAMQDIVASVSNATQLMQEIGNAATAQRDSVSQVTQAINQIDTMTQQNAALVEQSAAAAASLSDQAERLARAVDVFNVGSGHPEIAPRQAYPHRTLMRHS